MAGKLTSAYTAGPLVEKPRVLAGAPKILSGRRIRAPKNKIPLRVCLKTTFGVAALAGWAAHLSRTLEHFTMLGIASVEPAKAGTPNLRRTDLALIKNCIPGLKLHRASKLQSAL